MIPNTNLHDSGMRIGVNTTRPIWENISQVKIFQSPRYLIKRESEHSEVLLDEPGLVDAAEGEADGQAEVPHLHPTLQPAPPGVPLHPLSHRL